MTEEEWLECKKPNQMLKLLRHRISERKRRLFGCACCRSIWARIDERGRHAVEVSEQFADGLVSADELIDSLAGIRHYQQPPWRGQRRDVRLHHCAMRAATSTPLEHVAEAAVEAATVAAHRERHTQCKLLRDILGNPFQRLTPRPQAIAPLAERIYAGEWSLMPLLGEWLQEHGYWGEGEHCLDPNNHHVKGCWVVDWVTGRE